MKTFIKRLINNWGYTISKKPRTSESNGPYSSVSFTEIVDLDRLANISRSIPGMIAPESGKFLYALCYMQELKGDVVEIGSWQGRSTSFLARAARDSGNGQFYAIDHFKGNPGTERFYVLGEKDLSDLRDNFENNMRRLGLWDSVNLLDMPNDQAVLKLNSNIRFLFIDGDHTKEGVEKDIELFFPLLNQGAIVVFDDFRPELLGLLEAIEELLTKQKPSKIFSYTNTLVLMF